MVVGWVVEVGGKGGQTIKTAAFFCIDHTVVHLLGYLRGGVCHYGIVGGDRDAENARVRN